MKKASFLFLLAITLLCGYLLYQARFQKIEVKDVSQSQTLTLIAESKIVYGLEAYVEGYLDDSAKIGNLVLGKGEVKTLLLAGDCYVDTFRITYKPYKAKVGNLTVKYRFNTD